ncbi:unnamed protein product (macronuclear) [Paramecium tetraurelia]|uniref:Uncharacterized protein n=1 Tax=Paramecium tetraurelia TaxID=5888 RepID=A0BWD0_PARTE|nr:uncharacterized protein GSPATT00032699001 [Paramecium tetraurelia]CAK62847.1 unnamed protein product [Paramecium tetraurelia]|eukprot:XP_001430245.1 hypothetical protein (macronuclear) [Paramecium tetraurelia strain d4-2]
MNKSVLLEMQLKEALDRETNLKKLNESLMQAMRDMANQDKGKEIHLLNQLHQQELSNLKTTLQEKIIIIEYEVTQKYYFKHRKKSQEFIQLQNDYNQLQLDYQELEAKKCLKCLELQQQLDQIIKQNEIEKEGLAREFTEALTNQKSIFEYVYQFLTIYKDLNCLKLKLKELTYQLDCECKEKERMEKAVEELNKTHEQAQRSLMQQIADLNKAHNETIYQNNQYQMNTQQREQLQASKLTQNEQEKIILEKQLLEYKEINYKLDSQLKLVSQQLHDKETQLVEQKTELTKKLHNEKKIAEQCQVVALKLKNDFQRKQALLFDESLKKEQQLKTIQTQLTRQKSKNKFYENALCQVNLQEIKNLTPKQIKHKKNNLSNDYNTSRQPGHQKNTLSQGHMAIIKLLPTSIQKSEADSIHFNLTDMLNSTDQQSLSCRQSKDDITYNIEQFNYAAKITQTNEDSVTPTQILTDRQLSPRTRIQTVNPKGPIKKVRQIQADLYKENVSVKPKV